MSLIDTAQSPIHAVVRGRYNVYFGDEAFKHPKIHRRAPISHVNSEDRSVHFEDGTSETGINHIIFGTGFTWTLPFLPQVPTRNNRVPDLYQHVFYRPDPTLVFVGAVCLPSNLALNQNKKQKLISETNCRSAQGLHSKSSNGKPSSPHACSPAKPLCRQSQNKRNGKPTGLQRRATGPHSRSSTPNSKRISKSCGGLRANRAMVAVHCRRLSRSGWMILMLDMSAGRICGGGRIMLPDYSCI